MLSPLTTYVLHRNSSSIVIQSNWHLLNEQFIFTDFAIDFSTQLQTNYGISAMHGNAMMGKIRKNHFRNASVDVGLRVQTFTALAKIFSPQLRAKHRSFLPCSCSMFSNCLVFLFCFGGPTRDNEVTSPTRNDDDAATNDRPIVEQDSRSMKRVVEAAIAEHWAAYFLLLLVLVHKKNFPLSAFKATP